MNTKNATIVMFTRAGSASKYSAIFGRDGIYMSVERGGAIPSTVTIAMSPAFFRYF